MFQFSAVLSRVRLFATPWTTPCQASLSITNSWSLLKFISFKSLMPSNYFTLCHPLLLLPSICPTMGSFLVSQFFASGGQSRPVPMRVAPGPLGIPLQSMLGPETLLDTVPEPEDSSPVLTWILGYFWNLPRGVSPRLEWGHARALSSRAVAAVSRFPSRGTRDLWHSLEAFPRGFPTRLSSRAVPRATVV